MRDPNFKIDKAYTDNAWKEMQGVLDQHMPVKPLFLKRRFAILLLFLLLGISAAVYLTYLEGGGNNTYDAFPSVKNTVTTERIPASEENMKEQSVQDLIPNGEDVVNHSQSSQSLKNESISTKYPGISENKKQKAKSQYIGSEQLPNQHLQNEATPELPSKIEQNTFQDIHPAGILEPNKIDKSNSTIMRPNSYAYPFIPGLSTKLLAGKDWIADAFGLQWVDKSVHQVTQDAKVTTPMAGPGMQLSTRIWDGFKPNGELGINWGFSVFSNWRIRPGIGIGYDNYQWSSPAYEEALRSHFSASAGSITFAEGERKGYLLVSTDILYAVHDNIFVFAGGGMRMYGTDLFTAEFLTETPSMDSNEMNPGNVSSERFYIQPSSVINYFQTGVSFKINTSLYLSTSYLLQLNNGVKDTRLGGFSNAILNPGKRQEWRIGLNYDF